MATPARSISIYILLLSVLFAGAKSLSTGMARVAVVTGANKGIGRAIAEQLASSGKFSDVILGCRDERRGSQAAAEISASGASRACRVSYHQLTIGDKASHTSFGLFIESNYGSISVLVNNAGMAFKNADPTPFEDQCKPTLDVNFRGTADFTEEMLPLIRKGHDPRIVNVASMSGHLSQLRSPELRNKFSSPHLTKGELHALVDKFESDVKTGRHISEGWGSSNYGLSKLALIAMTKIWAREEAVNGISVNCCCPGYCDTDMTSHRGPRPPEEGAKNAVLPAIMDNPPSGEYISDLRVSVW